ncbi:MAG TPA: hypothetical protein VL404_06820 [Candidatus Eisenbacteria bacterium]|nr:hypothetical protein [Candidatus Eisenbacteria bacterium]
MKRFVSALVLATMAGLFYVNQEVEAVKIGYEIRRQEEAKVQALDHARALKYNIARLKAPKNLEKKLLAERIQLESPGSWQTLVLPDPGAKNGGLAVSQDLRPPFFTKFFVGTAQAEAKESR